MIKTLLINPITKETTEAYVDPRSLEQLYEFNGTSGFSVPLVLANGDSLLWHIDSPEKKESGYFYGLKDKLINSSFLNKSQKLLKKI
jgi:hypothetical protein